MALARFGKYELISRLAKGGMGETYLAELQAVAGVIVQYVRHGKIEEPEAVRLEREELERELENATPEERAEIEKELAGDPLLEEAEEGVGKARIAFGPFLVLATLELLLFGGFIRTEMMDAVFNP